MNGQRCLLCGAVGRFSYLDTRLFGHVPLCQKCVRSLTMSPWAALPYAGAFQETPYEGACDDCLGTGFLVHTETCRLMPCRCITQRTEGSSDE